VRDQASIDREIAASERAADADEPDGESEADAG
jgi:hypothetical protein